MGQIEAACATLLAMRGYDETSYGDGFADVYDDWYADVTDVGATVERMRALAGVGGSVLELGVGTGRLAAPMADAGLRVTGVDSSAAMLDKLRQRAGDRVEPILGDMVTSLPSRRFDAALVAYNTIFNLLDAPTQQACFAAVASRLRPGGHFVVEAFVPDVAAASVADVSVRSMTVDRVVLSISQTDSGTRRASGQFVEFTEAGGVKLRPWSIFWSTPAELDAMAASAGLALAERAADMAGGVFTGDSPAHVSVYRRPTEQECG